MARNLKARAVVFLGQPVNYPFSINTERIGTDKGRNGCPSHIVSQAYKVEIAQLQCRRRRQRPDTHVSLESPAFIEAVRKAKRGNTIVREPERKLDVSIKMNTIAAIKRSISITVYTRTAFIVLFVAYWPFTCSETKFHI